MMLSGCGKEDKSNDAAESAATTEATEATEATDGCRIATAHYGFESAEGFGKRFSSMVKTLVVIDRQAE